LIPYHEALEPRSLTDRLLAGDRRALARAATLVENGAPDGRRILQQLFPKTGQALTLGITGPPGAGKSTLTDQLIAHFRGEGKRVAVVAVDPTSPYSGGAILGDRIRMQRHWDDDQVFVRSMATRGAMGGLATATADLVTLLDGAGWDVVLIETVGVGQDEVEIAKLARAVLVVLVPGMGDDVQAIKAGIMEIADVFVLNKADQPGIEKLEREVQYMLTLGGGKSPEIVRTVASEGEGIAEVARAARAFVATPASQERQVSAWRHRLREMARSRILDRLPLAELDELAVSVAAREREPIAALDEWLDRSFGNRGT
jgi:LAO/AO transport system kinase